MSWWGKILGGAFGYALGGPLGALLGAALGHQFDAGMDKVSQSEAPWQRGSTERTQTAFFTAMFSVMGHMAKVDGRVSEDEIEMARAVMREMSLNEQQKRVAIELFTDGKKAGFPLDDVLDQFRRECHRRSTLIQMFLEVLLHAAYADGTLHSAEKALLFHICDRLHIPHALLQQLESMVRAQRRFHENGTWEGGAPGEAVSRGPTLDDAYTALGINSAATDAEVKKAYRRLMNQHHPDKLVAKGLPEEMINVAKERTQEIQAAYEKIKKSRSMK